MIILLDTNAFIWWVADDKRLGARAKELIANPSNKVYVSNLSIFECSIKVRLGKLKVDFTDIDKEISEGRILELRYDTLAARQFVSQNNMPHADPFDFAITAQAISKRMTLITSDGNILGSGLDSLQVIDAQI
ncbi:MAG TPA: type II toxin-antitoxin system VapC family toxin [Candidatus Dormibacteraeota bacterium]|nr:type II toxin-antitoxin system VapC family toxin [Candidatus Dormibacteraeota bacterium]